MSGAITALIGATIGAIATVVAMVVQTTLASRADAERRREARENDQERARRELVRRYLFQLQDAVVSLQRRLDNGARRGGQAWSESVDPGYWDVTTLYALGRALAAERILSLEGVYATIDQQFSGRAELLSSSSVDEALQAGFHQLFRYHRLALAESLLEWRPEGVQTVDVHLMAPTLRRSFVWARSAAWADEGVAPALESGAGSRPTHRVSRENCFAAGERYVNTRN